MNSLHTENDGDITKFSIEPCKLEAPGDKLIQQAALKEAGKHFFWNKKAMREMQIQSKSVSDAYELTVQTFIETRSTSWKSEPYVANSSVSTGSDPPNIWEVKVRKNPPERKFLND